MKKKQRILLIAFAALSVSVFASCSSESEGKKAARDCYETFLKEGPDALKERIAHYGETLETLEDMEDFQEEMEKYGLF